MTVGEQIEELVREQGTNLRQLAIRANVPYNTIYAIVRRNSDRIQWETLEKIAAALGTTPAILKGDIDAMKIARGTEPLQSKANSAIAHREMLSEEILADWEQNKDVYLSNIQSAKDNLIRVAERICTNVQETDDEAQRISDQQWLPTRLNMISEFISANEKTLHMAFPGWRDLSLPQTSSDPNKE